jgi:hypothetical protein
MYSAGCARVAIDIKAAELDRSAREPAQLEGTSLAEAVGRAPGERHGHRCGTREAKRRRVEARLARLAALPVVDSSDADGAIYDEHGLPGA